MSFSAKFVASIVLAVAFVNASPSRPSTHRTREINGLKLEVFAPASTYEVFGQGLSHPLGKRADESLEEAAVSFVQSRVGADANVQYRTGYTGQVASQAYIRQTHDNVPFANAVSNVAFNKDNRIVAFGSNFVKPSSIASAAATVEVKAAIATAEKALAGSYNGIPTTLEYLALSDGTAALVHVIQIQSEDSLLESYIDAHSGELLSVTDFTAHATYRVIPIENQDVPAGFKTLVNPEELDVSPLGWHSTVEGTITDNTSGNNALAYKTSQTTGLTTSTNATFVFQHDAKLGPTEGSNLDVARTNTFYLVNRLHDVLYKYGWTEEAFNFQQNNFGKGGAGNDRVLISVQARGANNAGFSTPPDGQSGMMDMYIWDKTTPNRDGDLANDIVTHELGHGLSNRLTGGGTGRCLQTAEASGMGEGWSDTLSEIVQLKQGAPIPDFAAGAYVSNTEKGVRAFKYSTDKAVNPYTYASARTLSGPHALGTVWATILHQVIAALVKEHGFNAGALSDASLTTGNAVYLHLLVDSLALQPCNPTFVAARDAWIQADEVRYAGANKCLLWKAFASRGLGLNAAVGWVEGADVPADCA